MFMNIYTDNKFSDISISTNLSEQSAGSKSTFQLQDNRPKSALQKKQVNALANGREPLLQKKENKTGLPDQLKTGIENLSGHSMDDVKVHYNSDKPAQLNAHAYAQGTEIHLASGQEKHLPHEAWHVVQQKEGRVKPTLQMKGKVNVNDDKTLEKEADVMGANAMNVHLASQILLKSKSVRQNNDSPVQGMFEEDGIKYSENIKYGIPNDDLKILLVKANALPPQPLQHFQKINELSKEVKAQPTQEEQIWENEGGKTPVIKFDVYSSNKKLNDAKHDLQPNDCGMYANALALDKKTWGKEREIKEHLKGMNGPTDDSEQYDANDIKSKDNLSLDIGDMYRIDWDDVHNKPIEKSAHHVSTVVAKDGEDHVTSEADAGEKLEAPIFRMYGTKTNTFWQTHHEYFSANNQKKPFVSKFQNPKNKK
jgi:hypothetical protein